MELKRILFTMETFESVLFQNVLCVPLAMYEDLELIEHLPVVPAQRSIKYTFPSHNKSLSDTGSKDNIPEKIHFSVCEHLKSMNGNTRQDYCVHEQRLEWSVGVDIRYNSFVTIPGSGDIKIHTEEIGKTRYVYLSSITREEISAKEIRSRIKHGGDSVLVAKPTKSEDLIGAEEVVMVKKESSKETLKSQEMEKDIETRMEFWQKLSVELSVNLQQMALSLIREEDLTSEEVLRLTLDQACMFVTKKATCMDRAQRRPNAQWNLTLGVTDLQLDNQVQKVGSFDFPVVLIKRDKHGRNERFSDLSMQEKMEFFKSWKVFHVDMGLVTDIHSMTTTMETTVVNICPINLFVEDTFVYFVLQNVELLLPVSRQPSSQTKKGSAKSRRLLPKAIARVAYQYACPVIMQKLIIEAVTINVSIHASIKLFLAIDNSPLSFGSFERMNLCSTSQSLVRSITMHFASGALFRAGEVS